MKKAHIRAVKDLQNNLRPLLDQNGPWSEGEFEDVLFVYQQYDPTRGCFFVPLETLRMLAQDARLPKESQPYLQLLIEQAIERQVDDEADTLPFGPTPHDQG